MASRNDQVSSSASDVARLTPERLEKEIDELMRQLADASWSSDHGRAAEARDSILLRFRAVTRERDEARKDTERIDWLGRRLFPLPWGGVVLTIEGGQDLEDGTPDVNVALHPSSGDAPIFTHCRQNLRDAIDAARQDDGTT